MNMAARKPTKKRAAKKSTKKKRATKKRATKARSKKPNGAGKPNGKGGSNVVDINKGKDKRSPAEKARSQMNLDAPGMAPSKPDPKLTVLADELYNARTERLRQGKLETSAQARLLAEMQGKELELYVDTELGFKVTVEATDFKVKVKKFDPDEE